MPALIDALQDEWEGTRGQVCHALRSIGAQAAGAAPALETLTRDPIAHVRQCAVVALAAISADPARDQPCLHPPVSASTDVLPPVPHGPGPDWHHDVPQTVLEPRLLVLPVSYRVNIEGTVTSACIEVAVDPAVAASVRKALLSRQFQPAMATSGPVAVIVRHELELERRDSDQPTTRCVSRSSRSSHWRTGASPCTSNSDTTSCQWRAILASSTTASTARRRRTPA